MTELLNKHKQNLKTNFKGVPVATEHLLGIDDTHCLCCSPGVGTYLFLCERYGLRVIPQKLARELV